MVASKRADVQSPGQGGGGARGKALPWPNHGPWQVCLFVRRDGGPEGRPARRLVFSLVLKGGTGGNERARGSFSRGAMPCADPVSGTTRKRCNALNAVNAMHSA
jgi:hypothetical protein